MATVLLAEDDDQVRVLASDDFLGRKPGTPGGSNDIEHFNRPADMVVDPETNEIFVADGYANHRVIVFDAATGAYKRHWGAYGKPPTDEKVEWDPKGPPPQQFGNPVHCIGLAKDGLVYVCDRINNRVQVFHKDGTYVTQLVFDPKTRGPGSTCCRGCPTTNISPVTRSRCRRRSATTP